MATRSTRNKVRYQAFEAYRDLRSAENHLGQLAGIADDRSDYIEKNLPNIMVVLRMVIEAVDKFNEGL